MAITHPVPITAVSFGLEQDDRFYLDSRFTGIVAPNLLWIAVDDIRLQMAQPPLDSKAAPKRASAILPRLPLVVPGSGNVLRRADIFSATRIHGTPD
jgi:hypothetical protein